MKLLKERLANQFRFSIFEIALAGMFVGLWILSGKFFTIQFGFVMRAGITYVWMIILGLTVRPVLGILTCVIGDTVSLALSSSGLAQWTWAYAIIPICIYLIAYAFKYVYSSKREWFWWLINSSSMVIVVLFTLIVLVLKSNFIKSGDPEMAIDFSKSTTKIVIWTMMGIIILTQITMMIIYALKKQKELKFIITSYSLVSIVIIVAIWIWGPIANVIWLNRFGKNKSVPGYYWKLYPTYLWARIFKTPIILPLYTLIVAPLYKATQISKGYFEQRKW